MAKLNLRRTKKHLNDFDWETLFLDDLGWLPATGQDVVLDVGGDRYTVRPVAQIGGVAAFEVDSPDGGIPGKKTREAVHRAVEPRAREHALLFTDVQRTQTIWSYPVYDGKKLKAARSHHFVKGQPPDLFLSKIQNITFDLEDLDETDDVSILRGHPAAP